MNNTSKIDRRARARIAALTLAVATACAACSAPLRPLEPFESFKDYGLVYALPEASDPAYAWLSGLCASKGAARTYKGVTHERAFAGYASGGRYAVIADASGRLAGAELRALGVRLEEDGPRLGRRHYDVDDALFVARYGRDGAEILLETAYRASAIVDRRFDMPEAWGYALYGPNGCVIERGDIRRRPWGYALRPTLRDEAAAAASPSATGRKAREAALDAALAAYVSYPEDGDYGYIDALVAPVDGSDVRMVFMGEEHYQARIHDEEVGLAWHLRRRHGYGVFAKEDNFTEGPFAEAAGSGLRLSSVLSDGSIGKGAFAEDPVFAAINEENRSLVPGERLLCTAVDIDHAVNHTKSATIRYWAYQAAKCRSEAGRADLAAYIPTLSSTSDLASIAEWLDGLEGILRHHGASIDSGDRAEMDLALRLERASARYQLDERHGRDDGVDAEFEEIRGEYFRASIERAWRLAAPRGGRLACCVGGAHAILTDFERGDYPVGRISEARYFNEEFAETAGAVRSILIRLPGMYAGNEAVMRIVRLSAGKSRVFIDLRRLGSALGDDAKRNDLFTSDGAAKVDGLLLLL